MSKETTILLGGNEKLLKFNRLTILKYAEEYLLGDDPLNFLDDAKPASWYKRVRAFTIAGLRGAGDETPVSELDPLIEDMSFEDAAKVLNTYTQAVLGGNGQAGEVQAQEAVNA